MNAVKIILLIVLFGTSFLSFSIRDDEDSENSEQVYLNSLFKKELCKYEAFKKKFSKRGDTLLTFLIKRSTKDHLDFIKKYLRHLCFCINKPNRKGQFPLQIALQRGLLPFAVELVKSGADIKLVNKNLLTTKIGGKLLINELILSYLQDYVDCLSDLRRSCPISKLIMQSLEQVICDYCKIRNIERYLLEGNKSISDIVDEKRNLIKRILTSGEIEKKILRKALFYFKKVFISESSQKDQTVLLPSFVHYQLTRLNFIIKKIMRSRLQSNLIKASDEEHFSDLEIVCSQ